MVLLHSTSRISTTFQFSHRPRSPASLRHRFQAVRSISSSLPSPVEKAEYSRELEVAIDAVERACRLCVDVKRSLFSSGDRILEKNDRTPVTVADFGVQALVSLELSKLFPSIPLVAEEDSAAIRSNYLADLVLNAVSSKASSEDHSLTTADIFKAIDRGGKAAVSFGTQPATYWVLDPLDGTRGFQQQNESLYVVGLALVVKGEIVLGVMGCPTWQDDLSCTEAPELQDLKSNITEYGIIMVSHIGHGTWTKKLSHSLDLTGKTPGYWTRCFVDATDTVHEARFCIPNSHKWESLPLSTSTKAKSGEPALLEEEIFLSKSCCGSLCKYMMVASGQASVFILETKKAQKAWDHAVGMICVHEAGGKMTDWEGSQIDLAADISERRIIFPAGGILATNGNLHDTILDMISLGSSTI